VLEQLIDTGNTVIVIEHNLEVIKQGDWVIDLGPGAGVHGGRVVAMGRPEEIMANEQSYTGLFLREVLEGRVAASLHVARGSPAGGLAPDTPPPLGPPARLPDWLANHPRWFSRLLAVSSARHRNDDLPRIGPGSLTGVCTSAAVGRPGLHSGHRRRCMHRGW
jgi:hypothetical protein